MKRWLRILLVVLAIAALVLTVRRGPIIRRTATDDEIAVRASGVPEEKPEEALPLPPPPEEPVPEEPQAPPLEPLPEEAAALAEADLEALRAVNGDAAGWILIPDTEVSYPLMHGEDNDYYLYHTWDGADSAAGSIFIECESDPALEDFHTLIYGHRMKNDSMFGSLKYYSGLDYWQAHPSVYILTAAGAFRYDIFSAQEAPVDAIVYELDFTGIEADYVRYCVDNSVIDTGIEPEAENRFITLVTCTGKDYSARWVVHAVLAQEYELPEAG